MREVDVEREIKRLYDKTRESKERIKANESKARTSGKTRKNWRAR